MIIALIILGSLLYLNFAFWTSYRLWNDIIGVQNWKDKLLCIGLGIVWPLFWSIALPANLIAEMGRPGIPYFFFFFF